MTPQGGEDRRRAALEFLAAANRTLSASLDYETTLSTLARLAVPELADWCAVDMAGPGGEIRRLAVAHVDPAKVEWARELQQRYPSDPDAPHGIHNVLRTGRSEFYPEIPDAMLVASAVDAEHLAILRRIGLRSAMVVPLNARGRTLGALTFATTDESGRHYGPEDLALAEDLAQRAALAVDNARLYREAQQALRAHQESEERLRGLIESSFVGMLLSDLEGGVVDANDAFLRMIGYTRADLLAGRVRWDEMTPPEQQYLNERAVRELRTTGVCTPFEKEYIRPDGSRVPVLLGSALLRGSQRYTVTYVLDMTERKQAEEALRESEQRFEIMANAAPVLIWMAGTDAGYTYFNRSWLHFTGRTMAQEIGDGWLGGVHPDDRERCLSHYISAFAERAPFEREYRLRRFDGAFRWLMDIGTPRFLEGGRFAGYIGSAIDITERRNAEQVLMESEARQRALLRDVLKSVTEGKLILCQSAADLPPRAAPAGEPIPLSRAAFKQARRSAQQAATAQGLDDTRINDLVTATSEAAMNAVVHGGGGIAAVGVTPAGAVQVWVEDTGGGIELGRIPQAIEKGGSTAGSLGHGFFLMLQSVDRLYLLTGPSGTTVVIEQERVPPEPAWLAGRI